MPQYSWSNPGGDNPTLAEIQSKAPGPDASGIASVVKALLEARYHKQAADRQSQQDLINGITSAATGAAKAKTIYDQNQSNDAVAQYLQGITPYGANVSPEDRALANSQMAGALGNMTPEDRIKAVQFDLQRQDTERQRQLEEEYRNAQIRHLDATPYGGAGKEVVYDSNGVGHIVTGNAGYKASLTADAAAGNENAYNMVTTPGTVGFYKSDFSENYPRSTAQADASPDDTVAVLPDKSTMPYKAYRDKFKQGIINKQARSMAPAASEGSQTPLPSPRAIQDLLANHEADPSLETQFDEMYGSGAAAQILAQQGR